MSIKQKIVTLKNTLIIFLVFAILCFISVGTLFFSGDSKTNEVSTTTGAPTSTALWTDAGNFSLSAPKGSGTANDPYLISSAEELAWISANYSGLANGKYFLQTASIDLGQYYWNPINNSGSQYSYYYDGNNFEISNLFIDSTKLSSENYVGLFGHNYSSSSCYIKNVRISSGEITSTGFNVGVISGGTQRCTVSNCVADVEVNGNYNVGGIVGSNWRSTLSDCINKGNITGTGWYIGGLVGENYLSTVQTSYNTGTISGDSNIGGILGYNIGTVTKVYNTGSVSANWYAGGIVGFLDEGSTVNNCYNKGALSGTYYMGGIAAQAKSSSSSVTTVSNSFNVGVVSTSSQYRGGIFGECSSTDLTTSNNYFSTTNSAGSSTNTTYSCGSPQSNSFGTSRTYSAMTASANDSRPSGFDSSYASTVWVFTKGETPMLVGVGEGDSLKWDGNDSNEMPTLQSSGSNSESNPYIIDSASKLVYLSANSTWASGKYFLQTVDIDLNFFPWTPINNSISIFDATFFYDGGNNIISNLYINAQQQGIYSDYIGLFGNIYGSTTNYSYIKNLGIVGGSVSGNNYVGAIVGDASYVNVINCFNQDVKVEGVREVGGIVGSNSATVDNCYNTGEVVGDNAVGGIAGYSNGLIMDSHNMGVISGQIGNVGGIAGSSSEGHMILGCYNEGSISSLSYSGGIVGSNQGVISSSYNAGEVIGEDSCQYIGGIAGHNSYNTTITNCYNTGDVIYKTGTISGHLGGIAGESSGTIAFCFNQGNVSYLGSGNSYVGGLVGINRDDVSSSYNAGNISGGRYSAGIVACSFGNISNCYNIGTITGSFYVGGIVASASGNSTNKIAISGCYNAGSINFIDNSNSVGGIIGSVGGDSQYVSVSWCYYDIMTTGDKVSSAITNGQGYQVYGLTTENMQGVQSENYMYLSSNFWNFADGEYPTLKYVATPQG